MGSIHVTDLNVQSAAKIIPNILVNALDIFWLCPQFNPHRWNRHSALSIPGNTRFCCAAYKN